MNICLIACLARNRAIGLRNRLLYQLPADMLHFKQLTMGHTLLMGRLTYESLPHGALPGRRNMVLSRSRSALPGCEVYASVAEALAHCTETETVFVMGGQQVYTQLLPLAHRLYLTEVDALPPEADTFFPPFEHSFVRIRSEVHKKSESNPVAFAFNTYACEPLTPVV